MTAALQILFVLLFIGVNALNPFYVKAQRNGANPKSLLLKMLCATGYLATGLIAVILGGGFGTTFPKLLFLALFLCWIGDLFLHLWQHKILPAVGFLGFLSAHFVFIAAFTAVIGAIRPERSFFSVGLLCAVAGFDLFFLLFSHFAGTKVKGLLAVPLLLYATVITTMLYKAVEMGAVCIGAGRPHAFFALLAAGLGALCFVASDFTIAMLMFNEKQKKNYPLKMFNMVTYFLATLLLSALPALVAV